jgi:hypothetical protein
MRSALWQSMCTARRDGCLQVNVSVCYTCQQSRELHLILKDTLTSRGVPGVTGAGLSGEAPPGLLNATDLGADWRAPMPPCPAGCAMLPPAACCAGPCCGSDARPGLPIRSRGGLPSGAGVGHPAACANAKPSRAPSARGLPLFLLPDRGSGGVAASAPPAPGALEVGTAAGGDAGTAAWPLPGPRCPCCWACAAATAPRVAGCAAAGLCRWQT